MSREVREDQHGTLTGYRYGCRCHRCTAANREKQREWRTANPERARELNQKSITAHRKRRREERLAEAASFTEVQIWANSLGFTFPARELKTPKGAALIARYDREHPDRPYRPQQSA